MMVGLDAWDITLLAVSAYVAVTTLVRLMRRRRDGLISDLLKEAEREQRKRMVRERREEHRQMRERMRQQDAA
jgi:hypothetical protein